MARDGREGGESIYHAAISGLLAVGCDVLPIGVATTPTAGIVAQQLAHAAMVVTASHNPALWNGLKSLIVYEDLANTDEDLANTDLVLVPSRMARAPGVADASAIIDRFERGPVYEPVQEEECDPPKDPSTLGVCVGPYERAAVEHVHHVYGASCTLNTESHGDFEAADEREFFCVVDSVNASGSTIALTELYYFGRAAPLFCDGTGRFPHTPEPTRENLSGPGGLCDAVPGLKADIGFAQDPDADRLAIIDEKGRYIGEEYTLAIAAESVLTGRIWSESLGKRVLVCNLSTSRMIEDVAARHNAEVVRTPVGEANVVERMIELRRQGRAVYLGGEGNGGVIWPQVTYVRDSLSAMALTLSLMARTGKTVSELVAQIDSYSEGGRGYAIVKRKAEIKAREDAAPAVAAVAEAYAKESVDLQDGVRVDFSGPRAGCWVHVRASNTE
ncbi:MAG: hypothetical protein AAFU70_11630, partial [Planctomycetota bacterium]